MLILLKIRMELPTMEQQENDLKSLVSKTAEKVRYYACAFFGSDWCASHKTQPADNDVKVEKVELVWFLFLYY